MFPERRVLARGMFSVRREGHAEDAMGCSAAALGGKAHLRTVVIATATASQCDNLQRALRAMACTARYGTKLQGDASVRGGGHCDLPRVAAHGGVQTWHRPPPAHSRTRTRMHFALAFQPQPQPQPAWLGLAADDAVVDDEGAPATSSGWSSLFTPVGAVISEEEQIEVVPLTHAFVMQCNSIVGAGASLSRAPPACSPCCLFACGPIRSSFRASAVSERFRCARVGSGADVS